MNTNIRKKCCFFMIALLLSFVNDLFAAGFAEAFKGFVLGVDQKNVNSDKYQMPKLPNSSYSIKCMECHDGGKARSVTLKHADTPMKFTGHGSNNHPVGMIYSDYATKDPVVYVSPDRLDKRIILENGEVTCISCHSLKSTFLKDADVFIKTAALNNNGFSSEVCTADKKELTTGSNITTLCLSCHAL